MKKIVPIIAGPFTNPSDCMRWGLHNSYFSVVFNMRKTKRGLWYVYDRSVGTYHYGNKEWRKWMRLQREEIERLGCDDCGRTDGTHNYEVEH